MNKKGIKETQEEVAKIYQGNLSTKLVTIDHAMMIEVGNCIVLSDGNFALTALQIIGIFKAEECQIDNLRRKGMRWVKVELIDKGSIVEALIIDNLRGVCNLLGTHRAEKIFGILTSRIIEEKREAKEQKDLLEKARLIEEVRRLKKSRASTKLSPERNIQLRLQSALGGQTEVRCPTGYIDLLTESEIIEIKSISGWKSAIGQVVVYGKSYPFHQKRIHLFGAATQESLIFIKDSCVSLGIVVTFENYS